jgi:hypothetical protein
MLGWIGCFTLLGFISMEIALVETAQIQRSRLTILVAGMGNTILSDFTFRHLAHLHCPQPFTKLVKAFLMSSRCRISDRSYILILTHLNIQSSSYLYLIITSKLKPLPQRNLRVPSFLVQCYFKQNVVQVVTRIPRSTSIDAKEVS